MKTPMHGAKMRSRSTKMPDSEYALYQALVAVQGLDGVRELYERAVRLYCEEFPQAAAKAREMVEQGTPAVKPPKVPQRHVKARAQVDDSREARRDRLRRLLETLEAVEKGGESR